MVGLDATKTTMLGVALLGAIAGCMADVEDTGEVAAAREAVVLTSNPATYVSSSPTGDWSFVASYPQEPLANYGPNPFSVSETGCIDSRPVVHVYSCWGRQFSIPGTEYRARNMGLRSMLPVVTVNASLPGWAGDVQSAFGASWTLACWWAGADVQNAADGECLSPSGSVTQQAYAAHEVPQCMACVYGDGSVYQLRVGSSEDDSDLVGGSDGSGYICPLPPAWQVTPLESARDDESFAEEGRD